MKKSYPSDINHEQFEEVGLLLERGARKKTAPRKVGLHGAFCAVLYLLRTGCQWPPAWRFSQMAYSAFVLGYLK